ncbi:hypothetical protein EV175_000228 [Coemansia sp. RSA 1933]|nr:hypothetical protein EV175_000228 [Coemansia sp. RSA 1933]
MDSFQYVYGNGQFPGANPMASVPMQHPGISGSQQQQNQGAFMQHMDPSAGTPDQHIQQQLLQQQHQMQMMHDPFAGGRSSPAPQQQMPNTYAARIINDPESAVFYHDMRNNTVVEHNARQMVSVDGTVFIEHLAGYSVVFVPNSVPIDSAICDLAAVMRPGQHQGRAGSAGAENNKRSAAAMRKPHVTKPSNPFIMYRNFKIREMRIQNPAINQTDISREAGKWWKEETEEVKEMFRAKYREEKQAYDVLKSKRARGQTESKMGNNAGSDDDMYGVGTKKRKLSAGVGLGLVDRSGAIAKPRSRTMPSNAYGASNARLSVSTDLRKHLAAKHHYESSGSAFIDGSTPFDQHPHQHQHQHQQQQQQQQQHDFHSAYAGMSATTVNNSPMASIADPYVDGAMPPISLGAVQVFQSVSMPQHSGDYTDHSTYMYHPHHENPLASMPSIVEATSLAPEGYASIAAAAAMSDIAIASSSAVAAAAAAVVAVASTPADIVDSSEHSQEHWGALSDYVNHNATATDSGLTPKEATAHDNSAQTTVSGGYSPHNEVDNEAFKLPSVAELSGSTSADTSSTQAEASAASGVPTSTASAATAAAATVV